MTVRKVAMAWCVAGALALAIPTVGAAQAKTKPKNATAECKDGTYSTAKSKQGACSGHGGVATWYADEKDTKDTKVTKGTKDTKDAKGAGKDTKTAAKTTDKDTKSATKTADKESKTAAKETKSTEKETASVSPRPADAPADATAQCNDGTYSKAVHHQGACSSHKGVKTWYK